MSQLFQTNGIIIREDERGEADRVLTVFTEDFGKIRLHAKGARRIKSKLGGRLTLFSLLNIHFVKGKRREIITDAYVLDGFLNIKQNLEHIKIAFYTSQIIDKLIVTDEKDEKLWTLISWVFESINKNHINNNEHLLLRLFEVKLLSYLGYLPDFKKNNPYSFRDRITKILHTLTYNHQNINNLTYTKKDLKDLKQATTLMMDMIY